MRYKQIENFRIVGPGLPESGAVAVGPAELEAAFEAGMRESEEWHKMAFGTAVRFVADIDSHTNNTPPSK